MDYFSLPGRFLAPDSRMEFSEMDEKILDWHNDVCFIDDRGKPTDNGNCVQTSIPSKEVEIKQLLSSHKNHKGLQCASKSIKHGKSPHTASILLLGQTGVGKSSTVNTLFQNKNLAKINSEKSCTKGLVEYEVKIPMKDLGVTNSLLKIIDTPGFGDTGGNSDNLDRILIQTLRGYFETRPKPSIVLIVAKFTDNRYNEDNSGFVKTLRLVESLKESVFEEKYTNYLLVLTHLMSELPKIRSDPTTRCESFANALPNYTNMKKPVVVLAENCPEDWELPVVNGFAKLPDGNYYPINLFREIERLLKNVDPMADAIIYSAFKDISQLEIQTRLIPIQSFDATESEKSWNPMMGLERNNCYMKTEIALIFTKQIIELWPNSNYPERDNILIGTLLTLDRMKIKTVQDLPFNKNRDDILKLMRRLDCHPIIPKVFESLEFEVPQLEFRTGLFPGRMFNVLNMELILENCDCCQIFERSGNFSPTPLGYMIPEEFKYSEREEITDICEIYDTKSTCMAARLKNLNIISEGSCIDEVNIPYKAKIGYNVTDTKTFFTGLREHRLFKISLRESNLVLSPGFSKAVSDLPEFDPENNQNSVLHYQNFFAKYGTHVVDHCYGGGSIVITLKAKGIKKIISSFSKGAPINWNDVKKILKKFIDGEEDFGVRLSFKDKKEIFQSCSISYNGGLEGYQALEKLFSTNIKEKSSLTAAWTKSLKNDPIILCTDVKLVSLSNYVKLLFDGDIAKAKDIQNAVEYFLRQKLHCTHRTMSRQNSSLMVPFDGFHEKSTGPSPRDQTLQMKEATQTCCQWF